VTELCELAAKYRTDKAGWYTPFYSLLLDRRRKEINKVLEVGIGTAETMAHVRGYAPGASLFMWRDYFPEANVYGIDIDQNALVRDTRVFSACSDSRTFKFDGQFDLIVDDGDHSAEVQSATFLNLFPIVNPGGLYIIEDAEEWTKLSMELEGYPHQIVLCPFENTVGKLIVFQK
jgi:hypothetical protein